MRAQDTTSGADELRRLLCMLDAAAEADCAELDRAEAEAAQSILAAPDGQRHLLGLDMSLRLTDVLQRCGYTWVDAAAGEPRLAKLCGRLGSVFPAEREAAYAHALRYIRRRGARWSALVRIPAISCVPPRRRSERAEPPAATEGAAPGEKRTIHPPEEDWLTAVDGLIAQQAWRSEGERILLRDLAEAIRSGQLPDDEHALWLRDLWWRMELRTPTAPAAKP